MCVICQVETREALDNLDAILAVEGVDGVFIGPADLAASMGYLTEPGHPEVLSAIEDAIVRISKAGKAPESCRRMSRQRITICPWGPCLWP